MVESEEMLHFYEAKVNTIVFPVIMYFSVIGIRKLKVNFLMRQTLVYPEKP